MSRLSDFSSWAVAEKRKLISQLIIDAVTGNSLSLAYALLGPRISQKEEAILKQYQREVDENEQRMYPEEIRQRLFEAQLKAIDDYCIRTHYQDITIEDYVAFVEKASSHCRSELILAYRDRLKARLDIGSEEAGQRPELKSFTSTLDAIFTSNPFELERLEHLNAFKDSIKEKLALSEKQHIALAGEANVKIAMQLEELQLKFDEKRAHHQSAIQLAYELTERSNWKLHDPALKDMSFEEFKALANYNVEQQDRKLRVTTDNCLTTDGNSLLHLAFYNHSAALVQFLIEGYNANLAQQNLQGQTPQQFANIDRNDDPFLLLVLSRDGKRELSPFLQAVQEHLENYQQNVLEANLLYRLFRHLFFNVGAKHERRVNEHKQVRQAVEAAQGSYHDDDAVNVMRTVMATSLRRKGEFFRKLDQLLLERDAHRLNSPHRILRRIDSATTVQNTDLLDAYNKKCAECDMVIAEKNILVDALKKKDGELVEVTASAKRAEQSHSAILQSKDTVISELTAEIVTQNECVASLKAHIVSQDLRLAKLEAAFANFTQNQGGDAQRKFSGPSMFS